LWANFKALIGIFSQFFGQSLVIWANPVKFLLVGTQEKAFRPVRDDGCKPAALLFRREDPPTTPQVLEQAWARRQSCGDFCRCKGAKLGHRIRGDGTNWMLLDRPQVGYHRMDDDN
jgi:hypothetical protein